MQDVGGFLHFDHERRLAARDVVGRADPREDAIDDRNLGVARRHEPLISEGTYPSSRLSAAFNLVDDRDEDRGLGAFPCRTSNNTRPTINVARVRDPAITWDRLNLRELRSVFLIRTKGVVTARSPFTEGWTANNRQEPSIPLS